MLLQSQRPQDGPAAFFLSILPWYIMFVELEIKFCPNQT